MARHTFFCLDAHTCGNPVRVVVGGAPVPDGTDMRARRACFQKHFDWIRTGLMFEPRGHDIMSGSILYPPLRDDCDVAILFIETSGCLPMCGHGTIGTVTVALEHGLVRPRQPGLLRLDTPAGRVDARYRMEGGKVRSVCLRNVPSFLAARDLEVDCPALGRLRFDVAYGGNFYAIIEEQENYGGLDDLPPLDIQRLSPELRRRINDRYSFVHPQDPDIHGVSHIQWTGRPHHERATARNAVFYGDKGIDRSPCGTGTSARMAQLHARGRLKAGEHFVHESIIGSLFTGCVEEETEIEGKSAIIPSIEGWARITGLNTIFIDEEDDPFAHGFLLT